MISKELLSKVLNLNMWKTDSLNISIDENKFYYNGIFLSDLGYQQSSEVINIYELAHKCKEWALSKGYYISLIIDEDEKTKCRYVLNLSWNDGYEVDFIIASEPYSTETEAIFKACQWILDNVKTNNLS